MKKSKGELVLVAVAVIALYFAIWAATSDRYEPIKNESTVSSLASTPTPNLLWSWYGIDPRWDTLHVGIVVSPLGILEQEQYTDGFRIRKQVIGYLVRDMWRRSEKDDGQLIALAIGTRRLAFGTFEVESYQPWGLANLKPGDILYFQPGSGVVNVQDNPDKFDAEFRYDNTIPGLTVRINDGRYVPILTIGKSTEPYSLTH